MDEGMVDNLWASFAQQLRSGQWQWTIAFPAFLCRQPYAAAVLVPVRSTVAGKQKLCLLACRRAHSLWPVPTLACRTAVEFSQRRSATVITR